MKIQLRHTFEEIISVDNLLLAWQEFVKGKRNKKDVREFSFSLMDNILSLHYDLKNQTYKHGGYKAFNICDPKPRNIHKASVRDRLVHHAVYRILYPFFGRTFISDSYSCRLDKGTHKAIKRFVSLNYTASQNNTKTCWVLKCDIKKFFASIGQTVLIEILKKYIPDNNIIWLMEEIIKSFHSAKIRIGLPLGNLTSQLFVNVYMNEFDQFMKHKLKAEYYIRYADDFVILSNDKNYLFDLIAKISDFLGTNLKLSIHPDKIFFKTIFSGIDFLGWVVFPDHRVLRATTKRKILKRIKKHPSQETLNSYFGLLKYGNTYKIKQKLFS
jgi:retron-type reverse transcriptase